MTFHKTLSCIDVIATAAFERYVPAGIVIDQTMSAKEFHPFFSKGISIRTDLPPPVDERITRLTGVMPARDETAWYPWLAIELKKLYEGYRAKACSTPLVWRTNGHEGTVPLIGIIVKLDLSPDSGQTLEERLEEKTATMALLVGPEAA